MVLRRSGCIVTKKKKKDAFGYFYSLSPNAGNVEYNNKVFNDMMMPGGGESECCQGEGGQAMSEDVKKIYYIIKDKHGNQLSAPNTDDGELWDRVAAMEERGRTGLSVVVYTEEGNKKNMKEDFNGQYSDNYKITTIDEMIEGMGDNSSDEDIDNTLRTFKKISANLGTHKDTIKVLMTESDYDPKNVEVKFDEVSPIPYSNRNVSLHTYKTPNYEFIREYVEPLHMVFLYFKNDGDLEHYMADVNGDNDIFEEGMEEDSRDFGKRSMADIKLEEGTQDTPKFTLSTIDGEFSGYPNGRFSKYENYVTVDIDPVGTTPAESKGFGVLFYGPDKDNVDFEYRTETWDDPGDYPSRAGGGPLPSYDYDVVDSWDIYIDKNDLEHVFIDADYSEFSKEEFM